MINKFPKAPKYEEIPTKINEIIDGVNTNTENIDDKQDVLTAGENIDISASVDYDVINGWEYDNYGQITLYGLAYGNNKFLKMTSSGVVYESSDGTTWDYSSSSSIGGQNWQNLIYGYNLFVALGFYGAIADSSDGSVWVTTSASSTGLGSNYWNGIAYGNNKYVVIGATGYVSNSVNATTWATPVQNTDLGDNSWQSVTYFNGKFVAIGSQGYISESTDGVNWTTATQNVNLGNNDWNVISHTNTQFFAISKYGYVSTSKDGENWSIATQNSVLAETQQTWKRVACNNNIMIAATIYNYTCKAEPTNITLISATGGGTATDVQINGTSITSNDVANIITNTAYNASSNKIATMSDVPAAQVNSDWNSSSGVSKILNKPTLSTVATTGDYDDLIDKPTLGTMASESASDYTKTSGLATVATSGSYNDLSNKPTIPDAQVQSNWNETDSSSKAYIQNKPAIPTVNNATLTITQGGTTKGTFTANASSNVTIDLDAGGSAPSNMVTTDTTQNITGEKTYVGDKRIKFKQGSSSDKLGFTLYNTSSSSSSEVGGLELRPNTISSSPLLALTSPIGATSTTGTHLGFRFWSASKNVIVPLPANIPSTVKSDANIYFTLGIKNGSTYYKAGTGGVIDLSNVIPDTTNMQTTTNLVTSVSSSSTDSQYPSAKLFYDTCGDIETILHNLNSGSST